MRSCILAIQTVGPDATPENAFPETGTPLDDLPDEEIGKLRMLHPAF